MAVHVAELESGGEVICMLMESNSIAKIPISGCIAMSSLKKGVYGYKPICGNFRFVHINRSRAHSNAVYKKDRQFRT
jgi:hypothetical protein